MKLHIGSGSVYLRDWVNVDLPQSNTHLASDRPDLVDRWVTDESDYYARHKDKSAENLREPLHQEYVCDRYGSFAQLPARNGTATEILSRHSFEHLSINEAHVALEEIRSKLTADGILRIDVPDHDGTVDKLLETRDLFYKRHLLGPRSSNYGYHMMSYTPERLTDLVESHGFERVAWEENIHFYPAFCLRFARF